MTAVELSKIKYVALCLTHNCNLRCTYCYSGEKHEKSMDVNTAFTCIDFINAHSNTKCVVTFFGGEPVLKIGLLKRIVSYSKKRCGDKIGFRLSTNGILLRESLLEYFKAEEIFFVLSIDGGQEQHDANRQYANGHGSYKDVMKNVNSILKFNPYTIAVSVIAPNTCHFVSTGVQSLFDKGFRYILQTLDYSAVWDMSHLKKLKKQYKILAGYYADQIEKGVKIYYSPFDERIKTWAQKPYGKGDLCDLANTQIAIAPSGRMYPCVQFIESDNISHQTHSIGDVFSGFNNEKRYEYVSLNYADKESCSGCSLEGRCATYCGCVNYRTTGRLDSIPPIICEHERILMPIVDKMASTLWRKNSVLFKRKFYDITFPVSSFIEDCYINGRNHVGNKTS